MAAPHGSVKQRGGMGGGSRRGGPPGGSGGGSWRQNSGRASPALSQATSVASGGGGSTPSQRIVKSGPLVDSDASAEQQVPQDVVNRLKQHVGQRIIVAVRGGARLQGTLSTFDVNSPITSTTRIILKDAAEVQRNGNAPASAGEHPGLAMPEVYLRAGEIGTVEIAPSGGPASTSTPTQRKDGETGGLFRTDKDISNGKATPRQRELQPWIPDGPADGAGGGLGGTSARKDEETFGSSAVGWDQFATNAKLFGAKTDYDEDLYTTKLNRSGANFKQREAEAERLAKEILNAPTENPHVAEERGRETTGLDEEDRFSGVQRSTNAYVPPGARKPGQGPPPPMQPKTYVASVNLAMVVPNPPPAPTPPGKESRVSHVTVAAIPPPALPVTTLPPSDRSVNLPLNLPPPRKSDKPETPTIRPDVEGQIREFVETERERVDKKKSTIVKSERERKLQELKKFGKDFQIKLPFPEELLPIIARTPEKQREVQERIKASQSKEANGSRERQTAAVAASPVSATIVKSPQPLTKADVPKPGRTPIAMHIQEIPPFGARKPPAVVIPPTAAVSVPKAAPEEPTTEAPRAKLNPTASSFVFKPNAAAPRFQPQSEMSQGPALPSQPEVLPSTAEQKRLQSPPSSSAAMAPSVSGTSNVTPSPRPHPRPVEGKPSEPTSSFFSPSMPKRVTAVNVRDDFNPFRSKVPDPKTVSLSWPFSGKKLGVGGAPGFGVGMSVQSPGHEDEPGMFINGNMIPPMGMAPSPLPNYAYGHNPVRYPSQQGGPMGPMPPMNMPPGQASPYPPFAPHNAYMGGGPMYPQGMPPPAFMNGPHPLPQNIAGGIRPGPPMYFPAQSPASPHPGSPYIGQAAPPPT